MNYQPPKNIIEVIQKIDFQEILSCDDPRYVDTKEARGSEDTLDRLARKFGLLLRDDHFYPLHHHLMFFGHVGSGKTTELRRYAQALSGASRFLVIVVDINAKLDLNNLKYADTLMAMTRELLDDLSKKNIHLDADILSKLENWFNERVLESEDLKQYALEINNQIKGSVGIPNLLTIFSSFTSSFKNNETYKESLRKVIRNSFSEFASAFNSLLRMAEQSLQKKNIAKKVLFIIDGTDRLQGEDARDFFIHDAEQLVAIAGCVIYTAPLSLKYERNLTGKLDCDLVLPMIKLYEKDRESRWIPGWEAMKKMLLLRADRSLFNTNTEIELLIENSGGHPREMLRLLKLCCELAEQNCIDRKTVDSAIMKLASDFRRFLEPEDYSLLVSIDRNKIHSGNDNRIRNLLYNLALLEYNDGSWRCSHPVIRNLEGYLIAEREYKS